LPAADSRELGSPRYSTIFWDFDGVIKDSVGVKSEAFERLFEPFGRDVAARVRTHHEAHGGMSRFEKLPQYLEWAGQPADETNVARYCELFSREVRQAVIDAPWVPGAREYLEANHARQRFVLVTATPQEEIEDILEALRIGEWFREVHGAPTTKADAVRGALRRWNCPPEDALLIGDATADYEAARAAGVGFLLRRTGLNVALQREHRGAQCEDFVHG
jgi:phosphoglycolate phosphatase-like HAD superfamily hydrolase